MATAVDGLGGLDDGFIEPRRRRAAARAQINYLSALAVLLIALFATWWVVSLVAVPYAQHRLGAAQIVSAVIGAPIVAAMWFVAVRMWVAVRRDVAVEPDC